MSYNAVIDAKDEDGDALQFRIERISSLLTHSAVIAKGDIIRFGVLGIGFVVEKIVHTCHPLNTEIAPTSIVHLVPEGKVLSDREINYLFGQGFTLSRAVRIMEGQPPADITYDRT